jgi:hypothetical protein
MTPEQRDMIMDLRDPPTAEDNDWEMLDDILAGDATLQISHEGGEFDALNKFHERMSKMYMSFFVNLHKWAYTFIFVAGIIVQITALVAIGLRTGRKTLSHS